MGLQKHRQAQRQIRTIEMNVEVQIDAYLSSQPEAKRAEMETLHRRILQLFPACNLWFLDGKDENGKVISNPNIGYGQQTLNYANGTSKEFYQIGISGNTTGISVYVMGLEDKHYLPETYAKKLGKATVTGYCIKFKSVKDIHMDVLEALIQDGVERTKR